MAPKKTKGRKTVKSTAGHMSIPSMDFKSNNVGEMISRMKKAHNIVIFVYANWCGHCHRAMPMYKSLVKKPKQNVFNLSVESEHLNEVNSALKQKFPSSEGINVQGYPTLLVMDKDGHITETLAASPENMRNATSGKIASAMNNNTNNKKINDMGLFTERETDTKIKKSDIISGIVLILFILGYTTIL